MEASHAGETFCPAQAGEGSLTETMFRSDEQDSGGAWQTTGGSARPGGSALVLVRRPSLAERYAHWLESVSARLNDIDLAPDLARDVGAARWWRGLATMVGLGGLAIAGWPEFAPLHAAPAMALGAEATDEFRSQMIMPLALGSDSGQRMGAAATVTRLRAAPERPSVDMVATLAQGDSFDRMLRRAGVGRSEAANLAALIGSTISLSEIPSGTKVDLTLGRRTAPGKPRPLDALAFRARFDLRLTVARQNGQLRVRPVPIKVDATPLRIRGTVGSSLYRSARAAGAPAPAIQAYLKTLSDKVDPGQIGSNDTFDMVVDYKRAETGETETGTLLYAGLTGGNGKPRAQLLRWGSEGRFFEASGVGEQREGLVAPVPGAISSGYGMRRHPILGYRRMHAGMDFRAGYGTPIVAVTDGMVQSAGRAGGCGNAVRLNHAGGLSTRYCHMSRMAVSRGQSVRRGQVIGYVGSTGLSTGPHLHYEMYSGGRSINPASVRFVTRAQLAGRELQSFRARLASLLTTVPGAALESLAPETPVSQEPTREIDRVQKLRQTG